MTLVYFPFYQIKFGGPTVLFFLNDLTSRVVFILCTFWFETMWARGTPDKARWLCSVDFLNALSLRELLTPRS